MKVLVTGAQGFAGSVLVRALRARGDQVLATGRRPALSGEPQPFVTVDLGDPEAVFGLVQEARPDAVCHLAGMTYLPAVLEDPEGSFFANVMATQHLVQAMRAEAPRARLLLVSSCTVYGSPAKETLPLTEDAKLLALHPYGVQKIGSEMIARRAALRDGMDVVIARPFNHTGPGQDARISVIHFARQIARAEVGLIPPLIGVGDLAPRRDFLDVQDVVRAYLALLDHPNPPRVVNVCSGRSTAIQEILDLLLAQARLAIEIQKDEARLRPIDVMDLYGDATRLRAATGWAPLIPLQDTLARVLAHERSLVQGG